MFRYVLFLIFLLNFTPISAFDGDEEKSYIPLAASRLTSDQEHTDFLKHVLNSAINNVMISSYSVSPRRLFEEGVAEAIINAAERGVKVYIYYEHRPYYSQEDYADLSILEEYCERFEEIFNHSKCVLRDKDLVAIGSYNWLSNSNVKSSDFSLVLSGGLARGLNSDVWQGIRFYQSLKHGNEQGLVKFLKDRDAFSTGAYQFNPGQFFYTLRTPDAHGILLDEVFEKAKTRVLLFSPFIRLEKLQDTLTPALLHNLQQRSVRLQLITLPSPCNYTHWEKGPIFSLLNRLHTTYPNFSYTTNPTLHAKTLMADDDLICEGSFNWLSAVSDIDHDANNFEMSVAIRGDIARDMIHAFEQTALGKSVLPTQPKKIESSLDPKRSRVEQSLKQSKRSRTTVSTSSDTLFKIFSGARCGKEGYCARLNGGDYLRDDRRQIIYFTTEEEAKEAAQALFLTSQTNEETNLESGSLWDELEEAAKGHLVTPSLSPTLGAQSSCSSSDSTFADSEDDDIYNNPQFHAELDRLEQGHSSQPQTSSQPTFSPILFDDNKDPFDHGSSSSSDPRPGTVPTSFDRHVKIFSGASFGKKGFCARFNDGGYLNDHRGQICYFATREIAKQEAYAAWRH